MAPSQRLIVLNNQYCTLTDSCVTLIEETHVSSQTQVDPL